ncbi:retrovirus-related pol polyprotein from transposon TNT 1-94 [Tanacetum coccineum]
MATLITGTVAVTEALRKAVDEAKLKDLKVKNYLFQSIDKEIMETILDKSTSKGIWNSMKQKYEGSTKEGEKVDAYLARTLTIVNKMKVNGDRLSSGDVVAKVLRSLSPKFNYVVCSIKESNNLETMTIDELHGSLLIHEQRMLGQQEEEQVLKVATGSNYRGRGRGRGNYRGRGRGRSFVDKSTIECYKCCKLGHFQSECPEWEKDANYAKLDDAEEMVLMAYVEKQKTSRKQIWFLDSGCSNHMTGDKEWFCNMDEDYRNSVKLGNDVRMVVMGKEKGVDLLMKNGLCSIYHPKKGLIIQTPITGNRMYVIEANLCHKSETGEKSQALDVFKKFKVLVEKEVGLEIKCLRTDRGGEYNSKEFKEFCENNGIRRQLTAPYTPHQNGVAERKNRSLLNMVRSVLKARSVPKIYWAEATAWCVHVLNRSPTASLEESTPEEIWSNRKPSVSYFRIFRCVAHVHVPKEKRRKLDDKSIKCVLFGVSEETKAYRLYNPVKNKIIISKDVVFEEETAWNWNQEQATSKDELEWEETTVQEVEESESNSQNNSNESVAAERNEEAPAVENQSKRVTKSPGWMGEYVSGEGLSDREEVVEENLAMFTPTCDPLTYDDAVRVLETSYEAGD